VIRNMPNLRNINRQIISNSENGTPEDPLFPFRVSPHAGMVTGSAAGLNSL
jgi:hypothetical protein